MLSNLSNTIDDESSFAFFPSIPISSPTKLKLKNKKIIKSSKRTKKIITSTHENRSITSSAESNDFSTSRNLRFGRKTSHKNLGLTLENEASSKKLKEIINSMQILAVFIIIFKIYSIIVKRLTNISRNLTHRDFRGIWNESMMVSTELAKYLKDLSLKTKMIKGNEVKKLALLTESFYKSIKIYENMHKKKKSLSNIIWKTLKFVPNLIKILINFDYIFPLEVFFPTNYLTLFAFLFKLFGILRKARRLILSSIKRWSLPKRRIVYLMKLFIVFCKMISVFMVVLQLKDMIFWLVCVQFGLYFGVFMLSINNLLTIFWRKKKENKKNIEIIMEIKQKTCEKTDCENVKKEESVTIRRRVMEKSSMKEEISI